MIISASRRTDIPAFYADWFFSRLQEGYLLTRNPMNPRQVSRISLSPDLLDGIVFWTKNPLPMLGRLDELGNIPYYFQFTLNVYDRDVERNIPSKNDILLPAFQALSNKIGSERVIWRYDPILLNNRYTIAYHLHYFEVLASRLSGYTNRCTVSFLDRYDKTVRNTRSLSLIPETEAQQHRMIKCMASIANKYHMTLTTCAEMGDFSRYGVVHGSCIDKALLEKIGGFPLSAGKDHGQRPQCGCVESIDIGAYNTCGNGCLYCYANYSETAVQTGLLGHDPRSPLLTGTLRPEDKVTERKLISLRKNQLTLFP